MALCNVRHNQPLATDSRKHNNTLNTSDLEGGGIAQHIILSHFLNAICSDAPQGHLTDVAVPFQIIKTQFFIHKIILKL